MGISRYYLEENNFVLSRLYGEISDQSLRESAKAFNEESKGRSDLRILTDCRRIENLENLTVRGTTLDAEVADEHLDYLIAILVNDSSLLYGLARAYQIFLRKKRKSVKIFKDIDEALSWLATDEDETEVLKQFVESV